MMRWQQAPKSRSTFAVPSVVCTGFAIAAAVLYPLFAAQDHRRPEHELVVTAFLSITCQVTVHSMLLCVIVFAWLSRWQTLHLVLIGVAIIATGTCWIVYS